MKKIFDSLLKKLVDFICDIIEDILNKAIVWIAIDKPIEVRIWRENKKYILDWKELF